MPDTAQILVFDPKEWFKGPLTQLFTPLSIKLRYTTLLAEVRQYLSNKQADICLLVLDDLSERQIREVAKSLLESAELILLSKNPRPDLADKCTQLGASFYFSSPIDYTYFEEVLRDIIAEIEINTADEKVRPQILPLDKFGLMYGNSRVMRRMYRKVRKVADSTTTVLLIGESGSGKELAARTVHILSPRREDPFLGLNCSAISPELLESELFGHIKGSFTGADTNHSGYFERAGDGTLFLDEITEMSPHLQTKLLRVLETGYFTKVGGEKEQKSDARIVAATNRDPLEAVQEGTLREDLFFRLAQFPIRVPPLRERGEDIAKLAEIFLAELNTSRGTNKVFSDEVKEKMKQYSWPGNVRELRHMVEHAYILGLDKITMKDLPAHTQAEDTFINHNTIRIPLGLNLAEAEKRIVLANLEACDGDKRETAGRLQISTKTLYNKLKRYEAEETETEEDVKTSVS